jgi:hypothetical protein
MKYYSISESIDRKVIGRQYPQSQEAVWPSVINDPDARFNHPLSFHKYLFTKAPKDVIVPDFVIKNSAKITDYISAASTRFPIISKKMVDIIDKPKSSNIQWLPTHLLWKETKIGDYFMLNPLNVDYEILDLEKSEFEKIEDSYIFNSPKSIFFPKNYQELNFYEKSSLKVGFKERIEVKKVTLNNGLNVDLYYLKNFYIEGGVLSSLIISEKIKQELEADKCTGFDLIEL